MGFYESLCKAADAIGGLGGVCAAAHRLCAPRLGP